MLDIDMGYPFSSALKSLADDAEESAKSRGHKLRWVYYDLLEGEACGKCAVCGREVNVIVEPPPNDAPITGEALAVSCDSPFGMYRQKLEKLAAKNWPKARAEIGAYCRGRGHLLNGWWCDEHGLYHNICLRCGAVVLVDPARGRIIGLNRAMCWTNSQALQEWRAMQAARDLEIMGIWREDLSDIWYIFEFLDGWYLTVPEGNGPIEWGEGWFETRWSRRIKEGDVPEGVTRKMNEEVERIRKIEESRDSKREVTK